MTPLHRPLPTTLPITLADRLEAAPPRYLNLSVDGKGGGNRPDLSIWPTADEDQPPALVSVSIGAKFGQQARYLDLTPDEARTLARHLIEAAGIIDREVAVELVGREIAAAAERDGAQQLEAAE